MKKKTSRMQRWRFIGFIFMVGSVMLIAKSAIFNPACAFSPSRAAVKGINKAVATNIRQALKPSFQVHSRYAKSMLAVAFSENRRYFATVSGNGSAQLWDAATGQKTKNIHMDSGDIVSLSFSHDGLFFAVGHRNGSVALWKLQHRDPRKVELVKTLQMHQRDVTSLIEVPGQGWLTSSIDGTIRLSNLHTGKLFRSFHVEGLAEIRCMALSYNKKKIISGDAGGKIRVWDIFTGQQLLCVDGNGGAVNDIAVSSDDVVATGLKSGELKLWNLQTGRQISTEKRHDSAIESVAIDHRSSYIATGGADGRIHISVLGKKRDKILSGHVGSVKALCFHPDDRFLFSAGADKTARCWAWEDNNERARMVVMQKGWAVVTPDGFFDGTLDGEMEDRLDAVKWSVEGRSFSVDGFMERYYEPALLGKILDGIPIVRDMPVENISQGFELPPTMHITIDEGAGMTAGTTSALVSGSGIIRIDVEATDQGGGIDEIQLFHNEKALGDQHLVSSKGKKGNIQVDTYEVQLLEGKNHFRAVGFNRNRIESTPVETIIAFTDPLQNLEKTLHVVTIGINKYKNPSLDLNCAVQDAQSIARGIEGAHSANFDVFTAHELYNGDATSNEIGELLGTLTNIPPQDTVVIYIAGHGDLYQNQWYFIPYDLFEPDKPSRLIKKGISSSQLVELMTDIGSREVLLLFDSCKSGAVADAFDDRKVMALMSRHAGIHVGAAATKDQVAGELKTLGHGLFTFALLKGISGDADRQPKDGNISVKEILTYVQSEMPILIETHGTQHQNPVVNLRGNNFLLADTERLN